MFTHMWNRPWTRFVVVVPVAIIVMMAFQSPIETFALPQPGNNIGVATGSGEAYTPSLVIRHDGSHHIVRSEDVTNRVNIWYKHSNTGASWSSDLRIGPSNRDTYNPRIAVELEPVSVRGRLYVVYQEGLGTSSDIYFSWSNTGATWSSPVRLDMAGNNVAAEYPAVAASNGRVYVAWADSRDSTRVDVLMRISSNGGTSWGPEIQLSTASPWNDPPRIAARGNTVVIAWIGDSATFQPKLSIARSDDAGASWRLSNIPSPSRYNWGFPSCDVALDDAGVAHVAFTWRDTLGPEHVYYSMSGEDLVWSQPVLVDDILLTTLAQYPSISTLAGSVWIAWSDRRMGDFDIHASWSQDGVIWGDGVRNGQDLRVDDTDRNVPSGDDATSQNHPTLATGGYGVYIAWEDMRSTTSSDIYFSEVIVTPLVITEVQDEPSTQTRIEIYNFARTSFNMNGVLLVTGTSSIDISSLGTVLPRSHFSVGAAPADFVANISLNPEGDMVNLILGSDVISTVAYGQLGVAPDPVAGESTSRYAGFSDYTNFWTRSASPSFRSRNAVPPPDFSPSIVLNEVVYDSLYTGDRFIELYLRTGTSHDLSGYRLVSDAVYIIPGGTVGPYPYKILFESVSPSLFANMDDTGDNVYLYDATGRLLDMVGWSTLHNPGTSVSRIVAGIGGTTAYNDNTAMKNGWTFDLQPSAALLELRWDAVVDANIGTKVTFPLDVTNRHSFGDYINIESYALIPEWPVVFKWPNGTSLTDSVGDPDTLIDLGFVNSGANVSFMAEVSIPMETPLRDGNNITVVASLSSITLSGDSVNLEIRLTPHLDIYRHVVPSTVYVEGSGPPLQEVADIIVTIEGRGHPIVSISPQDVVFQIDVSGSMDWSDPADLRIDAIQHYIDGMRDDDRASVIGFDDIAWVVANRPLTYTTPAGKMLLKSDANSLRCSVNPCIGGTNIDLALAMGNYWMRTYGNRSRERAEILLTDGVCDPPCTQTNLLVNEAISEGIVIFTVGLGNYINEAYLRSIAEPTGGQYYHANTPDDLDAIYQQIAVRLNKTVGIDTDVTDDDPMIEDFVAPYLTIVPGSFIDPLTKIPKPPDYMEVQINRTILQWNMSLMQIDDTWAVQYSVTSSLIGIQEVALYPDARVAYARWDGTLIRQPIPQAWLEVLAKPIPPFINSTIPSDGATGIALTDSILVEFSSNMNPMTVEWSITPNLTVTPVWLGSRILQLNHSGMSECTRYTVEITKGNNTVGLSLVPGPVPNPWNFTTVCINPFIISTIPVDNSTGVALNTDVVVRFSEPMDSATVLWSFSDPSITFMASWDMTTENLTLSHGTPFSDCKNFSIGIQGRDTLGLDLVPGPVPNPWSFRTICTPPMILSTYPQDGASGIPVTTVISANFSEAMDTSSVTWNIIPGISLTPSWNGGNDVLELAATNSPLAPCTTYNITIGGQDVDGNALVSGPVPNPWSFRTYCHLTVTYTITRYPEQGIIIVDGVTHAVPAIFIWNTGDVHRIDAPDFDPIGTSRLAFLNWSDGGSRMHDVIVGNVNMTITATYALQHSASLTLVGLRQDAPATITFTLWNSVSSAMSYTSWSSWVDDGSSLSVDSLVAGAPGERFITQDTVQWTMTASLNAIVTYMHQFTATVVIHDLDGHALNVSFTSMGVQRIASNSASWSAWVDAGTDVSLPDTLLLGLGERYRTLDVVLWRVESPLDVSVSYIHQFTATVVIHGLDGHALDVSFTSMRIQKNAANSATWSAWVDAGTDVFMPNSLLLNPGERYRTLDVVSWNMETPLDVSVSYIHQFTATVTIQGLNGYSLSISFTSMRIQETATNSESWSAWVDAGTDVSMPDSLILSNRERYRTFDDVLWCVDSPLDVNVLYIHQYRPRVTLVGTDENHTVGVQWRVDVGDAQRSDVYIEWFEWADAATILEFDNQTSGMPVRMALDPTKFIVDSAFDAVIRYTAPVVPPLVPEPENWKPLIALVYVILLFIAGIVFGSRPLDRFVPSRKGENPKAWKKQLRVMTFEQKKDVLTVTELALKARHDRLLTRLLLIIPFAVVEVSIGIASMQTGVFRIPEAGSWFCIGLLVNTALLMAGILSGFVLYLKGYRLTERDLLQLAETRENENLNQDALEQVTEHLHFKKSMRD